MPDTFFATCPATECAAYGHLWAWDLVGKCQDTKACARCGRVEHVR